MKKLRTVVIRGAKAPNEFYVSTKKCVEEEKIYEMEGEMLSDWHKGRSEGPDWNPGLHEEVMVFETEMEYHCCRGYVYGKVGERRYLVYLYDHSMLRPVNINLIRDLDDKYKVLPPRTFILRIPGIAPFQLCSAGIYGMPTNKPLRDKYVEGGEWTDRAHEVAKRWVMDILAHEGREIKFSVVKKLSRVIIVGDLFCVQDQIVIVEQYSNYLCNSKVAILSKQQYNQDLNFVQEIKVSQLNTPEAADTLKRKEVDESVDVDTRKMRHPPDVGGDTDWNSLLNEDDAQESNLRDPDSRLNLGSALFGMAVTGKAFSINTKARSSKIMGNESEVRKKQSMEFQNSSRKIQPEDSQALKRNDEVTSNGLPPTVLAKDSTAKQPQIKGKNLFKRVYDPDNCFENAYNSVQPDANSKVDSRNHAVNTIGFNEARIYDFLFRSNDRSDVTQSLSNSETAGCSTARKCNTEPSATSIRIAASEKSRSGDTKISSSNGRCNGPLREANTAAPREIPEKIAIAQPIDKKIVKSNGRFGRADAGSDQPNPFFFSRNIDPSKMAEAKVIPVVSAVIATCSTKSKSVRSSSRQSLNESAAATQHKLSNSLKRDRIRSVLPARLSPASLPTMVDTPPESKPNSNISKLESQSIMSEDVIDGEVKKRVNGYRSVKPFVCNLPPWSEVKTKAATKIDKTGSQAESVRALDKNERTKQVKKNSFLMDKDTKSTIVSNGNCDNESLSSSSNFTKFNKTSAQSGSLSATIGCQKNPFIRNTSDRLPEKATIRPEHGDTYLDAKISGEKPFDSVSDLESGMKEKLLTKPSPPKHVPASPFYRKTNTEFKEKANHVHESEKATSKVPDVSSAPAVTLQIQKSSEGDEGDGRKGLRNSYGADNLHRMLQGRVFVYGKAPALPYSSDDEFPYLNKIKHVLQNNFFKNFNSLQKNVIPNILRGRNVFIIDDKCKGKSLAYMVPIVAKILQDGKTLCKHAISGPFAVFVTGCINKGTTLQTHLNTLIDSVNSKEVIGNFIIQNDQSTKQNMKRGCDIMITTPESLLEMIEDCLPYFSFERLMYLVIDDGDICVSQKSKLQVLIELLKKIQHGLTSMGPRECPFQTVFVGNTWSPEMESATTIVDDPVLILNPLQAIVFASVKTVIHYSQTEIEKLNQFLEFFGDVVANPAANYKVVVVCQTNENVNLVQEAVRRKFDLNIYVFMHGANNCLNLDPSLIDGLRERWLDSKCAKLEVIACTDVVIRELGITNASHLIHFDVAHAPAVFSRRYCTMWARFKSTSERDSKKEFSLVSRVFLTSAESKLVEIVSRLKSLHCVIPPNLEEDYQQRKCALDDEKRLCGGFVRFGFCDKSEDITCPRRHSFLRKDMNENSAIPSIGQVEFRITETHSPSSYVAQMLRHFENGGGKMKLMYDFEKEFQQRSQFLKNFYDEEQNKVPVTSLEVGRYVAAWVPSTSSYLRAQIDSVLVKSVPRVIRLFCLDGGYFISRSLENPQIYELPDGYDGGMVSFAVELILANLKPPLGETDYIHTHRSKAAKTISSEMRLVGRVCLALGQRLWVDQLAEMVKNENGQLYTKRSLRKEYVDLKCAEYNAEHMKILYKSCENVGLSCSKYDNLLSSNIELDRHFHSKDDPVQWAHLPIYEETDIDSVAVLWTTYVNDVDQIFCNQEKFANQLINLNKEMNEEIQLLWIKKKIPEHKYLKNYFEKGTVVVVEDLERLADEKENMWVRGLITSIRWNGGGDEVLYDVFLVDVGEKIENIEVTRLLPIPKKFVSKLPFQAVALKLDHVSPIGGSEEWTIEARECVYNSLFPPPDEYLQIHVVATSKRDVCDSPCRCYNSFVILGELELGEKLVQENAAAYRDDGERRVQSLKAKLLKSVNNQVDNCLDENENEEAENDSEEIEGIDTVLPDENFYDDLDGWDIHIPDFEHMKPFLGEELASKLSLARDKQTLAIMPSPNSDSGRPDSESGCKSSSDNLELPGISWNDVMGTEPVFVHSEATSALKKPTTTWSQTDQDINLLIDIPDVKSYNCAIMPDKKTLMFETLQPPGYGFEINLFKKVEPKSDVIPLGAYLKLKLRKRLPGIVWTRLTEGSSKPRWIKHDLTCITSDDDCETSKDDDDDISPITPVKPKVKVRRKRRYTHVNFESSDSTFSEDEHFGNSNVEELMM